MIANEEEILRAVLASVEAVTRRPAAGLSVENRLIGDFKMESIDIIDLLYEIEKQLKVSINLAEVFQARREAQGQREQFDLKIQEIVDYLKTVR